MTTEATSRAHRWRLTGWITLGLLIGALGQMVLAIFWGGLYLSRMTVYGLEERLGYEEYDGGYELDIAYSEIFADEYGYTEGEDHQASRWRVEFWQGHDYRLQVYVDQDEETGEQYIDDVTHGGEACDYWARIGQLVHYAPDPGKSWFYHLRDQETDDLRYWCYYDFNQDGALDLVRERVNGEIVGIWVVIEGDWYEAEVDEERPGASPNARCAGGIERSDLERAGLDPRRASHIAGPTMTQARQTGRNFLAFVLAVAAGYILSQPLISRVWKSQLPVAAGVYWVEGERAVESPLSETGLVEWGIDWDANGKPDEMAATVLYDGDTWCHFSVDRQGEEGFKNYEVYVGSPGGDAAFRYAEDDEGRIWSQLLALSIDGEWDHKMRYYDYDFDGLIDVTFEIRDYQPVSARYREGRSWIAVETNQDFDLLRREADGSVTEMEWRKGAWREATEEEEEDAAAD